VQPFFVELGSNTFHSDGFANDSIPTPTPTGPPPVADLAPIGERSVNTAFKPPPQTANTVSIFLMIFINFLSNVVFSIVLPSLPKYILKLSNNTSLCGWAVAINSLGTFIISPVFGKWSDKRSTREVLLVSLLLMAGGNIWYALANTMWELLLARFIVGVAAANYAPAGAYLGYSTPPEKRTKVMAFNSAATVLGFICGPAFALVTSLKQLEFTIKSVTFNDMTYPGWLSAFLALLSLFCLIPFKEVDRKRALVVTNENPDVRKHISNAASLRSGLSLGQINKTKLPLVGVLCCLYFSFSFTVAFTIFETIGPLYTLQAWEWDVMRNSLMFLGIAVLCLIALASLQALIYCFSDRALLIAFAWSLVAGLLCLVYWQQPTKLKGYIGYPQWYISVTLVSVGYANGSALLVAIFSKILENHEQGVMMGWFSSCASIARMLAPPAASYTFNNLGPSFIFLGCAGLNVIAIILTFINFKHFRTPSTKK